MNNLLKVALLSAAMLLASCGGGSSSAASSSAAATTEAATTEAATTEATSVADDTSDEVASVTDDASSEESHTYVDYYVVGSVTGWGITEGHQMWAPESDDESAYSAVFHGLSLSWNDSIKVVYSADGSTIGNDDWYGDASGANLVANDKGTYSVYLTITDEAKVASLVLDKSSGEQKPTENYFVTGSYGSCSWGTDGAVKMVEATGDLARTYSYVTKETIAFEVNNMVKVIFGIEGSGSYTWYSGDANWATENESNWTVTDDNDKNVKVLVAGSYYVGLTTSNLVRLFTAE
ncbi:MAG: hypothetical protein K6B65_04795 [Bacilli bacterium]|nr:hypothetical protein [Bacilli bacterium]